MLLALTYHLHTPAAAIRPYLLIVPGVLLLIVAAIVLAHLITIVLIAILPALLKIAVAAGITALYAVVTKPRPRRR